MLPIMMEKASKPPSIKNVYCKVGLKRITLKCLKQCSILNASLPCVLICFCIGVHVPGKYGRVAVPHEESSDDEGLLN